MFLWFFIISLQLTIWREPHQNMHCIKNAVLFISIWMKLVIITLDSYFLNMAFTVWHLKHAIKNSVQKMTGWPNLLCAVWNIKSTLAKHCISITFRCYGRLHIYTSKACSRYYSTHVLKLIHLSSSLKRLDNWLRVCTFCCRKEVNNFHWDAKSEILYKHLPNLVQLLLK